MAQEILTAEPTLLPLVSRLVYHSPLLQHRVVMVLTHRKAIRSKFWYRSTSEAREHALRGRLTGWQLITHYIVMPQSGAQPQSGHISYYFRHRQHGRVFHCVISFSHSFQLTNFVWKDEQQPPGKDGLLLASLAIVDALKLTRMLAYGHRLIETIA